MTPTRPALRWPGGKWRIAPWVIAHFPPHKIYVEPFGGAASVLLQKPRCRTEIYNDLDGDLVTLFRVLRDRPAALAEALALTPYARDEYSACYEPTDDPVESSRRFVARSFMGQSSKGAVQRSGFDTRVNPDGFISRIGSLAAMPEAVLVIAERLMGVVIEQQEAARLLDRHDDARALFYVDPPYLPETRHGRIYRHEMTDGDHRDLLAQLRGLTGIVVLSGYPSALYDEALPEWRRVERKALADGARERTEVLWINPACVAALDAQQLPLLAGGAA